MVDGNTGSRSHGPPKRYWIYMFPRSVIVDGSLRRTKKNKKNKNSVTQSYDNIVTGRAPIGSVSVFGNKKKGKTVIYDWSVRCTEFRRWISLPRVGWKPSGLLSCEFLRILRTIFHLKRKQRKVEFRITKLSCGHVIGHRGVQSKMYSRALYVYRRIERRVQTTRIKCLRKKKPKSYVVVSDPIGYCSLWLWEYC